jgi:cytochrome c553
MIVLLAAIPATVLVALFAFSRVNVSALPEPGKAETYLVNQSKRVIIRRSSRRITLPRADDLQASAAEGEKLYGVDCAACHGMQGTTPTDAGRWMYPRAASLPSPDVQRYSDAELFWIVKNGIRLSGMPGFGKTENDMNIRHLVDYVRTLADSRSKPPQVYDSKGLNP